MRTLLLSALLSPPPLVRGLSSASVARRIANVRPSSTMSRGSREATRPNGAALAHGVCHIASMPTSATSLKQQ